MNRLPETLSRCAPLLLLGLPACISSHPPLEPRWFSPPIAAVAPAATDRTSRPELRLEDFGAAAHLDDRMAWRLSDVEMAFDDTNRWVAMPAETTRGAVVLAAFESGRFAPAPNSSAPNLRVFVTAYEAVAGTAPHVEVRLTAVYRPGFDTLASYATFGAEAPMDSGTPEAFATAIGAALSRVAADLVDWIPVD